PDELAILLALIGELNAVELLGTVTGNARHESACVRLTVATVLRAFPHPESAGALASLLSDPVAQVRAQAAVSLGLIGGVEKLQVLQDALTDVDGNVRVNAGIALRRLGADGLEALRRALRGGADRAGEAARFVLNLEEPALSGYRGQEYGSLIATAGGLD
ncbi:MAG: HEAT repeat domain-containing protein, partial [Candidatus Binatia bacterium]